MKHTPLSADGRHLVNDDYQSVAECVCPDLAIEIVHRVNVHDALVEKIKSVRHYAIPTRAREIIEEALALARKHCEAKGADDE